MRNRPQNPWSARHLRGTATLLALVSCLAADAVALGPMRTGMAEAGVRAWRVGRTDRGDRGVDQSLAGLSVARFLNDNVSLGVEAASFLDGSPSDSMVFDVRARLYWFPLSRVTPWSELRGGAALGLPQGNALRMGAGFGLRWVPEILSDHLALDLQLVGFERWRQDWPSEYVDEDQSSGRIEWAMVRSPWSSSRGGVFGHASPLSWPVFGVCWLF